MASMGLRVICTTSMLISLSPRESAAEKSDEFACIKTANAVRFEVEGMEYGAETNLDVQ